LAEVREKKHCWASQQWHPAWDISFRLTPDLAKTAWQKIDEQIKKIPDMQANWVYAHVRQKELFKLK
jgi:hypothetical protein